MTLRRPRRRASLAITAIALVVALATATSVWRAARGGPDPVAGAGHPDRAEAATREGLGDVAPRRPTSTEAPDAAVESPCDRDPASCGYPDASTTGPRTPPTRQVPEDVRSGPGWHYLDGGIVVDGEGAVLAGIDTRASVTIAASNVTVRDCVLRTTGETWGVGLARGSHLTVEHNRIQGGSTDGPDRLLVGVKDVYGKVSDVSVQDNDISRASTGIQLDAGLVQGNYVHDLGLTGSDHVNGLTSNGGTETLVIRRNTILNQHPQTDAIGLFQDFGPQGNRWIVDNFLGGGGYTVYAGANPGREATATGIHVVGNRFSSRFSPLSGSFGPVAAWNRGGGNAWRSNTWDATGSVVVEP